MSNSSNVKMQMEGLATLFVLDDEIRKLTSLREFGFFATNETHRLIQYHTAYLWRKKDITGPQLLSQSGTAEIDTHAPLNHWVKTVVDNLMDLPNAKQIHNVDLSADDVPVENHEKWAEILPNYLLWCPLLNRSNELTGGLIFFREEAFQDAEIKMITWLISSYQYTWNVLTKRHISHHIKHIRKKKNLLIIGLVSAAILLFPIRISVLGNATVVPLDPVYINAPIQGVIKAFHVQPGQRVAAGQSLVSFDKTDITADAEVNAKEMQLTQAKLRTAINQGLDNNKTSDADVPILSAQLAIDKAKIDYSSELLAKADVKSPIAGIVVFDSKEDWIGQPMHTGERILLVADPNHVQLKIMLPIANAIKLEVGADGEFFAYGQLSAYPVKITTLGYNAKFMPNKILAYHLQAEFIDPMYHPQLGTEGTVRLYGHRVPLIYYLLRRPLQAIRQTLGI